MTNMITNSHQHCDFCKRLNTTQHSYKYKTFKSDMFSIDIDGKSVEHELEPDYLIGKKFLLCSDCHEDSGYDKLSNKEYENI